MTLDRNELKVQALLEKISTLTTNYENQIADLRVEITLVGQQLQETQEQLANAVSEEEAADTADTAE
jgi:hypothetical protein